MSDTLRRLQEDRRVAGMRRAASIQQERDMSKMARLQPEMAADVQQLQSQFRMPHPVARAVSGQIQGQRQSGYVIPNDAARNVAGRQGIYTPVDDIAGETRKVEDQMTDRKAEEMRRKMAQSRSSRPVGIN